MSLEIVGFDPRYSDAFARLNYQWIEHYFAVEPEDRRALDHPFEYAIAPGGEIFFALLQGQAVGCVARGPKSADGAADGDVELAKMAVQCVMSLGEIIGSDTLGLGDQRATLAEGKDT